MTTNPRLPKSTEERQHHTDKGWRVEDGKREEKGKKKSKEGGKKGGREGRNDGGGRGGRKDICIRI